MNAVRWPRNPVRYSVLCSGLKVLGFSLNPHKKLFIGLALSWISDHSWWVWGCVRHTFQFVVVGGRWIVEEICPAICLACDHIFSTLCSPIRLFGQLVWLWERVVQSFRFVSMCSPMCSVCRRSVFGDVFGFDLVFALCLHIFHFHHKFDLLCPYLDNYKKHLDKIGYKK